MATPRLTQKDMTEAEQRELKTLLDRARIAHGRTLTNAETNQVKKEYIDKLMADPEYADMIDRIVITAEPQYLARFTSTNQVVSYQRRFMNAVNNDSKK